MLSSRNNPPHEAAGDGTSLEQARMETVREALAAPMLQALMNATHSAYLVISPERHVLFANEAMAALSGYTVEELLALPSTAVLNTPEDEASAAARILQATTAGLPSRRRELLRKDGSRVAVLASSAPLIIDNVPIAVVVEWSDRSAEHAAVVALRSERDRLELTNAGLRAYREMVAHASDAMLVIQDGRVVYRNGAHLDQIGVDIAGMTLSEFLAPEPLRIVLAAVDRILRGTETTQVAEIPLHTPAGAFDFEITLSATQHLGRPAVFAVARDITQRRALEQTRRDTERLEATARLAGSVAHEVANALGPTGLVAIPGGNQALDEALHRAAEISSTLARIGGQGVGRPEEIEIGLVLREVIAGLPQAQRGRVSLRQDAQYKLLARRTDLSLALEALILNALESGDGAVVVNVGQFSGDVYNVAGADDGADRTRMLQVDVIDSGVGMPAADQQRLFEPFFTTKAGRMGTGAALARSVVSAHGGQIKVESTAGSGTRLRISLPLAVDAPVAQAQHAPAASEGRRVLIVDDNASLRPIVAAILTSAGYEPTVCASKAEALAFLEGGEPLPDLMVLDVRLGDGSGIDIFEHTGGPGAGPATLFISGYTGDHLAGLEPAPNWGFLPKPFDREKLLGALEPLTGTAARAA